MSGWLEFEDICKNFHGVAALKHISFKAYSGQVLSLVGENGAGKSTLLKILGGDYQPSSGTYRINGEEKHFASPYEAIRAGVGLIYQERQMAPELTVAENIFMGALPKKGPFVDFKTLYARAKALLEEFGTGHCTDGEAEKPLCRDAADGGDHQGLFPPSEADRL